MPRSIFSLLALLCLAISASAESVSSYPSAIGPLLEKHCFECHAYGVDEAGLALDRPKSVTKERWVAVWKNLQSDLMPPPEAEPLPASDREALINWVQRGALQIDPNKPDPGRTTVRRLNRREYRYTIKDLFGIDYDTTENFPPDDTGYGFDTVGDALSISPLLMEKYLHAASDIVEELVHTDGPQIPVSTIEPWRFRNTKQNMKASSLKFDKPAVTSHEQTVEHPGKYEIHIDFRTYGASEATENSATLVLRHGDKELGRKPLGWDQRRSIKMRGTADLSTGKNKLVLELIPGNPPDPGEAILTLSVRRVALRGPMDGSQNVYPSNYKKVFFDGAPPADAAGRRAYAHKILKHFSTQAFRRPVDDATLKRLVELAMAVDKQPGRRFEHGIAHALTAVLVSPRFLFRTELQPEPNNPGKVVALDEFALAARLSYFLWGSAPDQKLRELATQGKLRANLKAEITRMLADGKADRFVTDFLGQWLQVRDVQTQHVEVRRIVDGIKSGSEAYRYFSSRLREAMRLETEKLFQHILTENKPVTELLTADYTFVNEELARFYGIKGVKGRELQKVALPKDSHRKGVLTHASTLIVSSYPTRTSPVQRGLFVLENILGTPPPPAPADVPELPETRRGRQKQTMREMMEVHRANAVCASCHARMDPIGLALENFNAIGQYRDTEAGKPIDSAGKLVTGEKFTNVVELAEILSTSRRDDFLRCITEKLLTYGIGRGLEYYDGPTVEEIVRKLKADDEKMQTLILAIVESPAFQQRRGDGPGGQ